MEDLIKAIEFIGIPTTVAICFVVLFLIAQIIGELAEAMGKIVPEILKIRKYFARKKKEKAEAIKEREESAETLKEVKKLLSDVNSHYSKDNITKRNKWMTDVDTNMQWVHDRADVYDQSIVEIKDTLIEAANRLQENTKMTEEMFVQTSRDRIIDFATKVGDESTIVSREEFNRIFKVYNKYEDFLKERGLTNGEVDVAYKIINDAYAYRLTHQSFLENIRGYDN